ncbi:MAG: orotidine-5'-phosphate decarboxylase [Deltaproteobacteria bacterium]|nr:orotidine-5'-phosphate decarboxylase [Deltaproteobacteria bacterium]
MSPEAFMKSTAISLDKRIIFALDVETAEESRAWVEKLEPRVKFFKVGLQLFLAGGFEIVDWILKRGCEVMLDLKFFDVPQTVASAVKQVGGRGVSFTTVHGNDSILRAAAEAKRGVKILAVTVLTSLDQGDLNDLGFQCSPEELVLSRARRALEVGCDGVVSSGLEAPRLRAELGPNFLVVVPGVRPVENRTDDQKRIVTVRDAFLNGADYVVIGRPLKQAADPLKTAVEMQEQIRKALEDRGI